MKDVLGLILGGGRGTGLYPLTKLRSEPAVPLAGKYRLIDIPISNCLNSEVHGVYVLTQFLSVSLHRHIANTFQFDPFSKGFVEVLAAQQTNETADWYQGTADAVRQNIRVVHREAPRDVLLLSGDQLYRMDFRRLLETHRGRGADVTIAAVPVGRRQVSRVGALRCDDGGRVTRIVEKPRTEAELESARTPAAWLEARGVAAEGREYLANMGIYLFSRGALDDMLAAQPGAVDLVHEVFSRCLPTHRLQVHLFDGYWEDLGTIASYHEAHLALASDRPPFDFASVEGVVYTRMRHLPASQVHAARVEQCLISDGCVVRAGARLERCVIGVRSRIGKGAVLRDTVVNGADRYETEEERADNRRRGVPDFGVGEGSLLERAIVDKDCRIGRDVRVVNRDRVRDGEGDGFVIRDGIVVIPNGTVVPDGTVI
jgi:glucose-1-phosphate adenylyltransferase